MRDFRTLNVWQKAHVLTLEVYAASQTFPMSELYGLTGQLRRSAASIPANIAEGCGRTGEVELTRFMTIAMGSASEVEYHLLLARDLGILAEDQYAELNVHVIEVKRMLAAFTKRLHIPDGRPRLGLAPAARDLNAEG